MESIIVGGSDSHAVMGYAVAQEVSKMENAVVRARIDEETKEEASAVLAAMGLTVSDAFRLMMRRIAEEKALPFDPLIPNAVTIAAMREARSGNLPRVDTVKDLIAALDAED